MNAKRMQTARLDLLFEALDQLLLEALLHVRAHERKKGHKPQHVLLDECQNAGGRARRVEHVR